MGRKAGNEKAAAEPAIADSINRAFQSSDIVAIGLAIGKAIRMDSMSDVAKKAGTGTGCNLRTIRKPRQQDVGLSRGTKTPGAREEIRTEGFLTSLRRVANWAVAKKHDKKIHLCPALLCPGMTIIHQFSDRRRPHIDVGRVL